MTDQNWQTNQLMREVRDLLAKKHNRKVKQARDLLCAFHSCEYMPALSKYLSLCHSVLPRSERILRTIGDVLPALESQVRVVEMLNSDGFMKRVPNAAKYQIRRDGMEVLFIRVRKGVPLWSVKRRRRVRQLERQWANHYRH